jgi:hypothetical protein
MVNVYIEAVKDPNGHEVVDGASAVQEQEGGAIPPAQRLPDREWLLGSRAGIGGRAALIPLDLLGNHSLVSRRHPTKVLSDRAYIGGNAVTGIQRKYDIGSIHSSGAPRVACTLSDKSGTSEV